MAQVSVVTISYDGKMEIPPVWVPVHDHHILVASGGQPESA